MAVCIRLVSKICDTPTENGPVIYATAFIGVPLEMLGTIEERMT